MRSSPRHVDPTPPTQSGRIKGSLAPRSTVRLVLVALALPGAVGSQTPPPLVVTITAPRAGVRDGDDAVIIEATVSDPGVRRAWLTAHGLTREVPVSAGRIRESVPALPGVNRVALIAARAGAVGRDAVTFFARGRQAELVVWVTWSSRGERLGLELTNPGDEACRRAHTCHDLSSCREADLGACDEGRSVEGEPLDDRSPRRAWESSPVPVRRLGSPWTCHVVRSVWATRYALHERLYHAAPSQQGSEVESLLFQLDNANAPARRAALLEALDRAAAPRPTATPFRAVAVLFPGTARERRRVFDGVLHGQRLDERVDVIEVTDRELRVARGDRP